MAKRNMYCINNRVRCKFPCWGRVLPRTSSCSIVLKKLTAIRRFLEWWHIAEGKGNILDYVLLLINSTTNSLHNLFSIMGQVFSPSVPSLPVDRRVTVVRTRMAAVTAVIMCYIKLSLLYVETFLLLHIRIPEQWVKLGRKQDARHCLLTHGGRTEEKWWEFSCKKQVKENDGRGKGPHSWAQMENIRNVLSHTGLGWLLGQSMSATGT